MNIRIRGVDGTRDTGGSGDGRNTSRDSDGGGAVTIIWDGAVRGGGAVPLLAIGYLSRQKMLEKIN